ncbi:pyroglutamylated RF-amide peptide receptor-like [Pocillopora damicornis]|uniref:pyroglutamylated RF-amide peptide receptor-like n=1 Tax=Pocillopora damicornis TaxID=46731 RepID=UPI000F54CA29|nr:pyroglutamylated RF-amide peptide receptor-like [Pocillopora damicornis]
MSESANIAISTVLFTLIIVDVAGNYIVCLIIKRNRDMRNIVNYLLVNLAVGDIIFAIFIAPAVLLRLITSFHPEGMTATGLCKFVTGGNVAWIGAVSSIFSLVAIAIERYYAVMHPFSNRRNFTKLKFKFQVIVLVSWIFSVAFSIPMFLTATFDDKKQFCVWNWPQKWMSKAYSVAWLLVVVLPLIVMAGLYSRVARTLWFKHHSIHLSREQRGVIRVRKRVTLMVMSVTAIFGICYGFMSVIYVLRKFTSYNISPVVVSVSFIMVLCNSAVNPFVYALLNSQFREKTKEMMCFSDCSGSKVEETTEFASLA